MFETRGLMAQPVIPMTAKKISKRFSELGKHVDVHARTRMMRTGLCFDQVVTARLEGQQADWELTADLAGWREGPAAGGCMSSDYHCPQLFWGQLSHLVRSMFCKVVTVYDQMFDAFDICRPCAVMLSPGSYPAFQTL